MTQPVSKAVSAALPTGKERRRWPRYPIKLEASVQINGHRFACVALNFCREGMFLKFTATPPSRIGDAPITVSLSGENQIPDYHLSAKVVRHGESGIRIRFREPLPGDLLQWLQQLSNATIPKRPSAQVSQNAAGLREFILSCGNAVLTQTLEDFHPRIGDHLIHCAENADNDADSTAFWDGANLCRTLGHELIREALHRFEVQAERFFTSPDSGTEAKPGSLSLIDQSDFEDWLNMTETAAPLEARHQDILRRLEFLLSQTHTDRDRLARIPLCPTFLGECFRFALDRVKIDSVPVRRACYQLFFSHLRAPFDQAIDQAKQAFHIDGDHPLVPSRTDGPTQSRDHALEETGTEKKTSAPGPTLKPPPETTPQPTSRRSGVIQVLNHLFSEVGTSEEPAFSAQLQQLERLLEDTKALPLEGSDEDFLNHLQSLAQQSGKPMPLLNSRLQQRLIVANRLTRALSVETSHAGEDQRLKCLERLRVPLLRLALSRPELFEQDHSPATALVNQIGKLEQWASEDTDLAAALDRYLNSLTEQLRNDTAEPEQLLTHAQQRLQQILQPAQKKRERYLQRLIDSYVGRQRINQAKLTVYQTLRQSLPEENVPKPLTGLLKAGWFHLLVLTHINHGTDSPQWNRRVKVIGQLHRWLETDDGTTLPEKPVQTLLDVIDTDLGRICDNPISQRQLIQSLSACLLGPKQGEHRRALAKVPLNLEQFIDNRLLALGKTGVPKEIQNLTVGEWIKIQKDGKAHPFKLVWIGSTPPLYLFVDASGFRRLELKPKQLALLFRNHTATRIRNLDLPLTDRATDRVFYELIDKIPTPSYDSITGLTDRKTFLQNLRYALHQSGFPREQHVVCQLELDLLHTITSVCGQGAEEALLRYVTQLIKANIPDDALPARLRDDVFAILLTEHSLKDALQVARTLRRAFSQARFRHGDQDYSLDTHIGLIPFSWGDQPDTILLNANATCLKAKNRGRNSIEVYKDDDEGIEKEKSMLIWAGRINQLFDQKQLFLRCQKIAPLRGDSPGHYEILIGAKDRDGNLLPPDKFIPAIEHFKRGAELDRWVLENTLEWMEAHQDWLERLGGFSINLSGQSLIEQNFQAFLERLLSRHRGILDKLTFEITETAAVGSFEQAARFIRSFKRLGCRFSLDDFGTGYASYAYLKHLEFDYLKIDGSFIQSLLDSPTDEEIVKSMNHIGHSLGLKTIAEYVENAAILARLKALGLDYAQGYHIGRPIPLHELTL